MALRTIGEKREPRSLVPHPSDPRILLVELTQGYYATIDAVDGQEVAAFNWCALNHDGKVYAFHYKKRELHRFIASLAGIPLDVQIDHVNRNTLDCRRNNLRRATHAQNLWNRPVKKESKTGVKNVHRCDSGNHPVWVVQISADRRRHYVGTFRSQEEAATASLMAERRLHGEFTPEAKPAPTP